MITEFDIFEELGKRWDERREQEKNRVENLTNEELFDCLKTLQEK